MFPPASPENAPDDKIVRLGMALTETCLEGTQGFPLAWAMHFVQDVVIIASMILMGDERAKS